MISNADPVLIASTRRSRARAPTATAQTPLASVQMHGSATIGHISAEGRMHQNPPAGRRKRGDAIPVQQVALVVFTSKAIIHAVEDALAHHRGKNYPPPDLWIDDDNYLAELRQLVAELRKLNAYLEAHRTGAKKSAVEVQSVLRHFDPLMRELALSFGKNFGTHFGKALGTASGCLVAAGIA